MSSHDLLEVVPPGSTAARTSPRRARGPVDRSDTCLVEVVGLSKKFGDKLAVDELSFVVLPGIATGFLGPNDAGKSTAMRMISGSTNQPTADSRERC